MNARALAAAQFGLVVVAGIGAFVHEPGTPTPAPDDDQWIDVMTYNVHQYWSTGHTGRPSILDVRNTVADADPDIIGLQESESGRLTSGSFHALRYLSRELDMHAVAGPPAREAFYGVSLLSRWPILESTWHDLPQRGGVESGVLLNTVNHPDGILLVAVTQFDIRDHPDERALQAQGLVNLLENRGPVIVLGDFNTPVNMDDEAHQTLSTTFSDAWVLAGLPPGAGPTDLAPGRASDRVDRILLRGDWIVDGCDTRGQDNASDHRAVICALQPEEP